MGSITFAILETAVQSRRMTGIWSMAYGGEGQGRCLAAAQMRV